MKTVRKFSLLMLAALAFVACSKDATETIVPVPEGEKVKTSIEFTVPSMGSTFNMNLEDGSVVEEKDAETRFTVSGSTATAEKKEKAIKNLCILQFDASGNRLAYDYVEFSGTDADGSKASIDAECEISATTTNSTIYFVANVQNTLNSYEKLADFEKDGIVMPTTAKWDVANEGIPMIYKYTGTVDYGTKITGINLKRMFAAVKFTFTPGSNFTGSTITLRNVPKKAFFDESKAASTAAGDFFDYTVAFTSGDTWYIPENKQADVSGCTVGLRGPSANGGKAPACGTYFNIAGKYNKGGFIYDATYCVYLGKNNTTSFNVERNNAYTITGTVTGLNLADKRVVGVTRNLSVNHKTGAAATANCYIVGRCGVTYSFDATKKGNGGTGNDITIPTSAKVVLLWEDVKNLIQNPKLENGKIIFTVGTAKQGQSPEGNAVIALCKSDNTVLWSWHIWSTAYNPYADYDTYKTRALTAAAGKPQATTSRSVDLMTRNLGAGNNTPGNLDAGGLLYQWGRKDPFVGANATSGSTFKDAYKSDHTTSWGQKWKDVINTKPAATAGTTAIGIWKTAVSVADAVAMPMVFVATGGDWCATKTDNLWGCAYASGVANDTYPNTAKVTKSIYDPCPEGWHVPTQDTWTAFTKNGLNKDGAGSYVNADANFVVSSGNAGAWNWGYTFYADGTVTFRTGTPQIYYPASGLRRAVTGGGVQAGELDDVGSHGYSWSASPSAAGSGLAGLLAFNSSGGVYPFNNGRRGHGFPVRCARETSER